MDTSRQPEVFVFYWTVGSIKLNKRVIHFMAVWGQCTKGSWICTLTTLKVEVALKYLDSAREIHTSKCCRLQMINSVRHFIAYDPGYSVLKIGSLSAHILHILYNHTSRPCRTLFGYCPPPAFGSRKANMKTLSFFFTTPYPCHVARKQLSSPDIMGGRAACAL